MKNLTVLLLLSACTPATVFEGDTATSSDSGIDTVDTSDTDDTSDTSDTSDTDTEAHPDGITVEPHDDVETVLVVTWPQESDAELSWIEYSFEDTVMSTPPVARSTGEQSAVLLGIPATTEVTLTIYSQTGADTTALEPAIGETGDLPSDLPEPTLVTYDPDLASPEGWALISVDNSEPEQWYSAPFFVLILDRQSRVVWYHEVPERRVSMFPQVSLDGTHLVFDEGTAYFATANDPQIRRVSLDFSYNELIDVDGLTYGFTEVEGGGFIRDQGGGGSYSLIEQDADGSQRTIWDCNPWLVANYGNGQCYTNAVNYSPVTNTILWSLPYHDTVLEIDRDSGDVLRVFGEIAPTHDTVPIESLFDFQHYPNYTPDGTFMASMHIEGTGDQQRAREYEVNDVTGELTEIWAYGEDIDDEYAYYSGEAYRLANGNTLMNYGTGGAAREVTYDKAVVWDIAFPDRMLTGHLSLIDDLYALLGPE
ncbi:MAG: hypothetical protein ACI8RZ_007130 [Myxococcota bacterium]|jgi:hypothetical protein